ncbi:MAG: response regulator, partial [Bacteroidota bacterium]
GLFRWLRLLKLGDPTQNKSNEIDQSQFTDSLNFGSLAGTRVLVAEDNKVNQMVARKFLQKWDIEVQLVKNGQEAVEAWQQHPFDLILMDVHMPIMHGMEAASQIRTLESQADQQARIPILAFTASVINDEIQSFLGSGMDDWVSKPFDPAVLYQKLGKHTQNAISASIDDHP